MSLGCLCAFFQTLGSSAPDGLLHREAGHGIGRTDPGLACKGAATGCFMAMGGWVCDSVKLCFDGGPQEERSAGFAAEGYGPGSCEEETQFWAACHQ